MSEQAVELRGVGKRYWKIQERSLVRSLVPVGSANRTELWALRDVDLSLEPGQTLGIVGRNGAGKSTLLRLLAGVTRPTTGTVTIRGRVAPLLSVGVGFHPEMTGRENVYVNGLLLGLERSRIHALFDDIVDFAELNEFIDTPVKFYSSGMFMRLGFSVAINADPDVLLVDEVLAVGDIGFRQRSFDRMRSMQREGTALVFVSHWTQALQVLCPRALCLHEGRIELDGSSEAAIARYHELLATDSEHEEGAPVRVLHRELVNADEQPVGTVRQEEVLTYRVGLRFERAVDSPHVLFRVITEDSTLAYGMRTQIADSWRSFSAGESTEVVVTFRPRLAGGTFQVSIMVTSKDLSVTLLHDQDGPSFFVAPRLGAIGVSDLEASIVINGEPRSNHRSLRFGTNTAAIERG